MRLQFTKMVQFSLLVKAGDRVREFNFRKLSMPSDEAFTVNVCDERGNRVVFTLEKKEGEWKVLPFPKIPRWIVQGETRLAEALEMELKAW